MDIIGGKQAADIFVSTLHSQTKLTVHFRNLEVIYVPWADIRFLRPPSLPVKDIDSIETSEKS